MKICCDQNPKFIMYYKVTIFTCTNVHHAAKAAAKTVMFLLPVNLTFSWYGTDTVLYSCNILVQHVYSTALLGQSL